MDQDQTGTNEQDPLECSFDLPHRDIDDQPETMEMSIDEPDLPDTLSDDRPVTFTVLPTGSQRGGPLLISSDGHSYVVKTSNGNKTRWRCSVRSRTTTCSAAVAQDGDRFRMNDHRHSHSGDLQMKVKKEVYTKAKALAQRDIFRPATTVAEEAIHETVLEEEIFLKPKTINVKRNVNRHRAKTRPQPPTDLKFTINMDFLNCDDFLIADINLDTCRHLVFSSPFQLNLLRQSRRWFIDGTFKIVGQPFTPNGQLCSINAFVQKDGKKRQFPTVFILMSRRRKTDYIQVLQSIKEKVVAPVVESFVLDFEKGAWEAVRNVFPEAEIKGCAFHWTQAVYRRVNELGLSTTYREKGPVYNYIRQMLALPFLPASHIVETFNALKTKANTTKLIDFVTYIEKQWMNNSSFPVAAWSIYNHTVRTNNDIEAWHRRMNCKGTGLSFYKLVPILIQEAKCVEMNVLASDLEGDRRTKYTKMSKRLQEAWDAYTTQEISTTRFLKKCSSIYGRQ